MTGNLLNLLAEALVAILLVITIGYCILLNQRLKRLRADESDLRATISELVMATTIAERAISSLKGAASDCDKTLATRIREAEYFSIEIAREIGEGQQVLNRIKQIAVAVRRSDAKLAAEAEAEQAAQAQAPADLGHAPKVELTTKDIAAARPSATLDVAVGSTAPDVVVAQATDRAADHIATVAVPGRTTIAPAQSKSGSRIEELRRMADAARERLQEMRRTNAEKAA